MDSLLLRRLLPLLAVAGLFIAVFGTFAWKADIPVDQQRIDRQVTVGYDPILLQAMARNWCWRL